jgi:glycosyltransferase involved in cell wall biosynthesis
MNIIFIIAYNFDQMRTILFYFNSLTPSGGIERVIVTLANKMCNEYNITILVKDQPKSFYELDVRVKLVSLNNALQFNMNSKLSRFFSAFISILKNSKALKIFLNQNSFDYYYLAHPLNVLEFHLARGIDKTDTVVTEHGAPDAYNQIYKKIKSWLYPKAKIYVVPTTADTKYYKSINLPALYLPHFRSDLPYEKTSMVGNIALSIGRFTDMKQQIVLLRVWNSLVNERNFKSWKLYIVGAGELKEEFENFIARNNLKEYVFILPPRKDVEYYYKQASLFLLTSKTEGFGMVLLEAISFGLPCISFDCPSGPRDIIKDNVNGYLISLNDESALEEAIITIINNPELKLQMGKESFSISENWKDSQLLEQWYTILN